MATQGVVLALPMHMFAATTEKHDIAIAIAVTMDDDSSYYVNTSMEAIEIVSSYPSFDAFLADVSTKGYSGMVVMDSSSSIT